MGVVIEGHFFNKSMGQHACMHITTNTKQLNGGKKNFCIFLYSSKGNKKWGREEVGPPRRQLTTVKINDLVPYLLW